MEDLIPANDTVVINNSNPYFLENGELLMYEFCKIKVYKLFPKDGYPCNCRYFYFEPGLGPSDDICNVYDINANYLSNRVTNQSILTNAFEKWSMLERIYLECTYSYSRNRIDSRGCMFYNIFINDGSKFFTQKYVQIIEIKCANFFIDTTINTQDEILSHLIAKLAKVGVFSNRRDLV